MLAVTFLSWLSAAYPQPQLICEPADVAKLQQSRILDVRGKNLYDAGHIPGAIWIDAIAWGRLFDKSPRPDIWGDCIGSAGITSKTPVLIYGSDVRDAARIWWILRYWGVKDVRLLNGGWLSWTSDNMPVSTDELKIDKVTITLTAESGRLETKGGLLLHVEKKDIQIVDARSNDEYCGKADSAKRNGRVPGAVQLEWTEVLDPKTKRFKSPNELASLIKDRKIDLDRPAVTYCQSGGRASVVSFAMELMGGKQVKNYYRSWSEWGNSDNTPIERDNR